MSLDSGRESELRDLCAGALSLRPGAVARLVSVFQDRRPTGAYEREFVLNELADSVDDAFVLGVTGTPGSGKSSLIGRLVGDMLEADADLSIAVVAVDPSSHVSGGALLGDRTRLSMKASSDQRLYFRSEASDTELGGLSPSSFQVCRLLNRLFDLVIIETVGIGQSEGDIRHLADSVFLVMSPLGGDEVQFFKAGIVEIPEVFVLNKSDEPSSDKTFHQLKSSLWLARPFDPDDVPIIRTSAKTGKGIDVLAEAVRTRMAAPSSEDTRREDHFFERWVRDEWGRRGVQFLRDADGAISTFIADHGGYDRAQARFTESFTQTLGK